MLATEVDRLVEVAWQGYDKGRKAPRTQKAGPGYADPDYDLSVEWIEASRRIKEAERRQKDTASPSRILLINGGIMIVTPVNWYQTPTCSSDDRPAGRATAATRSDLDPWQGPGQGQLKGRLIFSGTWRGTSFPWWCTATRSASKR